MLEDVLPFPVPGISFSINDLKKVNKRMRDWNDLRTTKSSGVGGPCGLVPKLPVTYLKER